MKLLIIANDIGHSAPGIVYQTIIGELIKTNDIDIILVEHNDCIDSSINVLPSVNRFFEHPRLSNLSMSLLGRIITDDLWVFRQKKKINKRRIKDYDAIISFVSNFNYKGILLGNYLSRKNRIKWVIYSVDAIPAPIGWAKDNLLHRNTEKFINKYIYRCDAFFSANEQMLKYQLNNLSSFNKFTGIMYTPYRNNSIPAPKSDDVTFLYTGSLYGPRKKEALLDGFRLFLKYKPLSKLIFVGNFSMQGFEKYKDLLDDKKLLLYSHTSNLFDFYKSSTVLIDINAYFDNDVFLSSKIVNYLPMNRPIISITGLNSPSRNIFTEDPTIIHCKHEPTEICNAMIQTTELKDFDSCWRKKYIEMFSVNNVIRIFDETIKKTIKE